MHTIQIIFFISICFFITTYVLENYANIPVRDNIKYYTNETLYTLKIKERPRKEPFVGIIKNIVKAVKPDQVETKSDLKSLFDTFLSDATDDAPAAASLTEDGLPKAWVVQVASFVDEGKANELRGALVSRDYKAFSKKVKIDGRDHFRVYIGPKIDKRNALKVKDAVDTEFNTESIVLNYVP